MVLAVVDRGEGRLFTEQVRNGSFVSTLDFEGKLSLSADTSCRFDVLDPEGLASQLDGVSEF